MTAPGSSRGARPSRGFDATALQQLGWPHFWLLSTILAGMLALVALVFLASSLS
jgi:hypothetical protein